MVSIIVGFSIFNVETASEMLKGKETAKEKTEPANRLAYYHFMATKVNKKFIVPETDSLFLTAWHTVGISLLILVVLALNPIPAGSYLHSELCHILIT